MNKIILASFLILNFASCSNKNRIQQTSQIANFNPINDLLLLQYDCKTDVDDLHSIAAASSLLKNTKFSNIKYHAVAGSYGIQDGKYVNANSLFDLAFSHNWSDAHNNYEKAVNEVYLKVNGVLKSGGNIWIAEAGQSDFSASVVSKIIKSMKHIDTKKRIYIVQHSNWNEEVTNKEDLAYVKKNCNYQKISDGNVLGNGTPGYNTSSIIEWKNILESEELIEIWELAINLADKYNGAENRYLNKSIKSGGMDFSDFAEVHHILNLENLANCNDYLRFIKNKN